MIYIDIVSIVGDKSKWLTKQVDAENAKNVTKHAGQCVPNEFAYAGSWLRFLAEVLPLYWDFSVIDCSCFFNARVIVLFQLIWRFQSHISHVTPRAWFISWKSSENGCLVGGDWNMTLIFPYELGMSSSQLSIQFGNVIIPQWLQ